MSQFDDLAAEQADVLVEYLGEREGVVLADGKKFDAVVGTIQTEDEQVVVGTSERTSQRDVCQIVVSCPPGTLTVKSKIIILKHAADGDDAQAFYVRSLDRETEAMTTATCWRERLAKVQRRGLEA